MINNLGDLFKPALNAYPEVCVDWFDDFEGPNKYAFLSNFYEAEVTVFGKQFPTTEHAFAWMKPNEDDPIRDQIQQAQGPGMAKSLGRQCNLRPDWELIKFDVMKEVVEAKFDQNPDLARSLTATGDAYLQEGTFWGDEVWGVDWYSAPYWEDRRGRNWLGMILMSERARQKAVWR
jgi:ribA/ribD-fused uncharacterized protein